MYGRPRAAAGLQSRRRQGVGSARHLCGGLWRCCCGRTVRRRRTVIVLHFRKRQQFIVQRLLRHRHPSIRRGAQYLTELLKAPDATGRAMTVSPF